ncbi:hypothetical protein Ddye_029992 [Dipteronia dyeriana]|uniref:hAT-like transposase RNase-H fold domain-containing protein n=1 Tax=Dipteronia dyeriana TaxID=168575 RepID=A0AAD9TGR5_9ROSI|nr:hypothetical protein Ddye_029992 [Dipteronia dyeriana]
MHLPSPKHVESVSEALVECLLDCEIDHKLSTLTLDKCNTEEDGDGDDMIRILLDKLSCGSLLFGGELFLLGYFDDWGTMYSMLSTALIYKDVFPVLREVDELLDSLYQHTPSINEADWKLAKEACDNLKLFFVVFEMSSGTEYATISQFFPTLCEIILLMSEWLISRHDEIRLIASNAIAKFQKYWNVINPMVAVATVLDPRFKMTVLEFYFPQPYGDDDSSLEMENVRKLCYALVNEYQLKSKPG